ncbi:MAG: DUF3137 domain-containing protein [Acidobacteria bacterium]|uniref:DUF3137 domain-containing protein n=1 Tax=Candidatus Polarisedimenticola svalbardensis TaxID=2886004 RepID=A0A8J6XY15_9BACT|nr:DUF3137 domain-containing protein [Candidatus Polarisedimenticola svalbardensis]
MLNKNFREHEKEVWTRLSEEIGGRFNHEEKGEGRFDTVKAKVGPWTITLDLHADASYAHEDIHTRLRAPYINPDGFRFNVFKASMWDDVSAVFGGQDVEVGDSSFDDHFRIRGSDEDKVKDLFDDPRLRELLLQEPEAHLYVRDSGVWWESEFPDGVDEIVLEVGGAIADLGKLERLYSIFAASLHGLCRIGSAYEKEPDS